MIFPQNYLHLLVHVFKHFFNQALVWVSYIIRPEILSLPTNRMLFWFTLYLGLGFGLSLLSLLLYWLSRCALSPKPTAEILTKFWHHLEFSRNGAKMLLVARQHYEPQTKGRKPHANKERLVTWRYCWSEISTAIFRKIETEDTERDKKFGTSLARKCYDLIF